MADPAQQDEVVLEFKDVSLRFAEEVALDHVSFSLRAGESRVILGSAGSGKTTLLKVAMGLLTPDSGAVLLFGKDIAGLTEEQLFDLRSRVGILFQEGALFDSLTVEENVAYPLLFQRVRTAPLVIKDVENKVRETLRFVELEHTLEQFPSSLSGGMRRRVGIARAVVTEPPLALYDSPTAGLDPITANTIMALIVKERDLRNIAAVVVTHRYQDGQLLADFRYNPHSDSLQRISGNGGNDATTRFMVMKEGKLVFEGTEQELEESSDPYLSKFVRKQ